MVLIGDKKCLQERLKETGEFFFDTGIKKKLTRQIR